MNITLRTLTPDDLPAVDDLQNAYARAFSGAVVIPAGAYLSPAFHGGQDVLLAHDAGGRLLAYAPLYVQCVDGEGPSASLPDTLWVEIKAHPDLPDPAAVKDALYRDLEARAQSALAGRGRPARMVFDYGASETPAVAYVQERGFHYTESVFAMARDLRQPLPAASLPEGITLRRWKMESEPEQRDYVAARCECFPSAPITLPEWQYFMTSPMWAAGTCAAAFDGEVLTGAALAYWFAEENQSSPQPAGYTEEIFVRPAWRGRGVATAVIVEAMRFLQEHGLAWARLSVRAQNANALGLYHRLGYTVQEERRFYEKTL
jgi:GNAT superfamily N-acetyltransferase